MTYFKHCISVARVDGYENVVALQVALMIPEGVANLDHVRLAISNRYKARMKGHDVSLAGPCT